MCGVSSRLALLLLLLVVGFAPSEAVLACWGLQDWEGLAF